MNRWKPPVDPKKDTNFVEGLVTVAGAGDPSLKVKRNSVLY